MENQNKKTNQLVITRTFNAPKSLVFKAITEEEHLAKWWGPTGTKLMVYKLDVRAGGIFHYGMVAENNLEVYKSADIYGVFNYIEVNPSDKIVFLNGFADKDANIIRAPFAENFPKEVHNTWTFTEENGKTTLTLTGVPYNATAEENEFFGQMHAGMNQGFGGTFDQLEKYLNSIR